MKTRITVLTVATLLMLGLTTASAQHEEGQMNLNVGLGLGSNFITGTGSLPPVSAAFDYSIREDLSIGALFGIARSSHDLGLMKWSYSYTILGVRGAYHKDVVDGLSTYAGAMLGYYLVRSKFEGTGNPLVTPSLNALAYAGFAGARYHFNESMGVYGEVGYGIAFLTLGFTMQF